MKKILLTFFLGAWGVLNVSPLAAQDEAVPDVPPDNVEAPTPTFPPGAAGPRNDADSDPSMDEKISVNFPDTTITQILLNYERLSGKRLIKDVNLQGQNISIVVAEQVTKREALSIIEATLLLNGYAMVPYGENQLKVLNVANKSPRSEGVAIYTTPSSLPSGDQVISYYMTFKYRDALQASQELQQSVQPHPTYGFFVPIPNAQALFVTESTSVIRRLIELKELIDVPPARIVSEFVPLIRADAERVAETITKMIDAQKNNAGNPPAASVNTGAPPAPDGSVPAVQQAVFSGGNAESASNSLTAGQIQLVADTRTNRILVISRPSSFPYIKSLIQEFDRSVGLTEPLEMPLRYIKPSGVLDVLADLLSEDASTAAAGGANQPPTSRPAQTQNRTPSNANNRSDSGRATSNSGLSSADSLDAPEEDLGPQSRIVGKTRIIADDKAGKILVIGPPESLSKVRDILQRLDHKPQQVYLSTVIGQLRVVKNQQFGIDYLQSFLGGKGSGIGGTAINSDPKGRTFQSPASLNRIAELPNLNGLNLYATVADNLSIYVKALESTNRFTVLSRPAVYASNNVKASISSGSRIAVPTQSLTNNNLNNDGTASVTSNIDYEEVVLKLEVIPQINPNNEVTMQIVQTNDSVNGSQTISGQTVPTIATQNIATTVTVADKNVVVLGGLVTETVSDNRSKIPLLGDIPYLGALFRNTTKNKDRNELLIFIQPNVVAGNIDAQIESYSEEARSEVGPKGRSTAVGPLRARPLPAPQSQK